MTAGIKANVDGSAAIQVGGTDVITLTSGGAATFVTSPTTVQAGTAAAPSITFSGDTNTGIYSPGADQVAIATGGSQRVTADASGNLNIVNGNLVISTSGKGIDFSATPGTGTSELLADYEEGSWTPAASTGTTTCTPTTARCKYTRVGNQVTCWAEAALTVSATSFVISGLPFAPAFRQGCGHGQFASSCNYILVDTDSTMTISVPATFSSITSRWFVTYTL